MLEILQEKATRASKKIAKQHIQADVLIKRNEHYATGLRIIKSNYLYSFAYRLCFEMKLQRVHN